MARILRGMFSIACVGLFGASLIAAERVLPVRTLELTRFEAERDALQNSRQLKAFGEFTVAAREQADAQYSFLFPRLSFDADYEFRSNVPTIKVTNTNYPFGAHNNYSYGPTLTYTIWDTFGARKGYRGLSKLVESREQDRRSEEVQLLFETRSDYVRVQESLDELRAADDSLELSRSQNIDIVRRYRGGASSHLDLVESNREVLSYEIQFAQKQADLSAALVDLLMRTQDRPVSDVSHPGPPGMRKVTLQLRFDPLQQTLADALKVDIAPPDDNHPRIRAQELLAQSSELIAESVKAALYPTVNLNVRAALQYPNGPLIEQVNQNTVGLIAAFPLFEMDHTRHLSEQKQREANTVRFREDQTRLDLRRDFTKAQEMLASLRDQQKLAVQDVLNSSEAARLYYQQYKAGRGHLTDVQTANNRAFLSKINKARIDAQVINQLDLLRALSSKETP